MTENRTPDRVEPMAERVDPPPLVAEAVSETIASLPSSHQTEQTDFLVFISYRIQPDEYIARAFKTLLEEVLHPNPRVFVSGVGGLRVSRLGFKTQIQRAAQSAKAMIGIITEHSLNREWIYYEAGAAFGRGIAYAPIVFGVGFGDIPSSVSDNQATDYRNEEAFKSLINVIAGEVGAEVKNRVFKRRYKEFLDSVSAEKGEENKESSNNIEDAGFQEITDLLKSGNRVAAKARSELLLSTCVDENKRKVLSVRIAVKMAQKGKEIEALESLPDDVKDCPDYHLYRYIYLREFRPQQAEACLRNYLIAAGRTDGDPHGLLCRIDAHIDLNQIDKAGKLLRELLGSDKQETRRMAAGFIAENAIKGMHFGERILCALSGLASYDNALLHLVGDLAHDQEIFALSGLCFKIIEQRDPSGDSSHRYGMSMQEMGFLSLAYEAYANAEKLGMSVSVATKASLFDSGKVAAHGIKILSEHQAGFADAASRSYPHTVRRDLENAVERETLEWKEIADQANGVLLRLIHFSDALIAAPEGLHIANEHGFQLGEYKYRVDAGESLMGSGSLLAPEFTGLSKGLVMADCYFATKNKKLVVVKLCPSQTLVCEISWEARRLSVEEHEGVSIIKLENVIRSSDPGLVSALRGFLNPT